MPGSFDSYESDGEAEIGTASVSTTTEGARSGRTTATERDSELE